MQVNVMQSATQSIDKLVIRQIENNIKKRNKNKEKMIKKIRGKVY